jgi:hypothetical protein
MHRYFFRRDSEIFASIFALPTLAKVHLSATRFALLVSKSVISICFSRCFILGESDASRTIIPYLERDFSIKLVYIRQPLSMNGLQS